MRLLLFEGGRPRALAYSARAPEDSEYKISGKIPESLLCSCKILKRSRARVRTRTAECSQNSVTFVDRCTRHLNGLKASGHTAAECSGKTCRRPVWSLIDPRATAQGFQPLVLDHNLGNPFVFKNGNAFSKSLDTYTNT